MNKETYYKLKRAYAITINGCGGDCFECERSKCLADTREIQRDARKWIKQKEHERKFYYRHREVRLAKSREYYNNNIKKESKLHISIINKETFDQLPDEFTYDIAARIWKVEKPCAIERINKFRKLDNYGLIKTRNPKNNSVKFKKQLNTGGCQNNN